MDHFLEDPRITEQQIIKEQYETWNDLIEQRGEKGDLGASDKDWKFTLQRKDYEDSLFTAESIWAYQLPEDLPLEKYMPRENIPIKTAKGEKWLAFKINPEDPFRSKVGYFTEEDQRFYATQALEIFLSNLGRAIQRVIWAQTLAPDAHGRQQEFYSYLKEYPRDEDAVKFSDDPEGKVVEDFEPMNGQSRERLEFLLSQVQQGNILERNHASG
ncbi:hypothetical protein HYU92_05575 [Candidatus Curtissbacteria bacterium]|nr:hypothetical protein [Candidatus Curtissbacteria bacterium]